MNIYLEQYLELFSRFIKHNNLEDNIVTGYKESLHGADKLSVLQYLVGTFYSSMENKKADTTSKLELYRMQVSHYGFIRDIQQILLKQKSVELSRLYWDSWLNFKKLEMNGEGLIRTNFAECCMNCYVIHRIYMSF